MLENKVNVGKWIKKHEHRFTNLVRHAFMYESLDIAVEMFEANTSLINDDQIRQVVNDYIENSISWTIELCKGYQEGIQKERIQQEETQQKTTRKTYKILYQSSRRTLYKYEFGLRYRDNKGRFTKIPQRFKNL